MRKYIFIFFFSVLNINSFSGQNNSGRPVRFFPVDNGKNINPDTHLILSFSGTPVLGTKGKIRVFDADTNRLIDSLDLSIPAGPTKAVDHGNKIPPYTQFPYKYVSDNFTNANTKPGIPSGGAITNPDTFQLNIIGRFTDAFHFYPVIINDKAATIYLHNNILQYNKSYYIQIDPEVLTFSDGSFIGITEKTWTFTTKKNAPSLNSGKLVVSGDGSGDFSTVQGAIDFVPDYNTKHVTIYIKKGNYEEMVYFRNKTNVTFLGEDRNKTVVFYANNEVFNPHPANISTNELPGTFPSRRAAFACDNSKNIQFINFTIKTTLKGQAEGLLIMGEKNILSNMNISGSGDALQANGSVYINNSTIEGDGDTFLSRGPAFFNQCEIKSKSTFMWMRNTAANHGVVLLNCKLINTGETDTQIVRAPVNNGNSYPDCEVVLINCGLSGISPLGWGPLGNVSNVHCWEYNSLNLTDGKPVDVGRRHPASRQLIQDKDAKTIANYSNPAYILNDWKPVIYKPGR
jgi:pectin methylesterase-like acyl-CoA thioesterase